MPAEIRPWPLAIGGLAALAAAMGVGRFVYTPILPFMVADLGMSQGEAGLIGSANFAGYLAGALLAATPVMSGSRRKWLLAGLVASAGTTALTAAGSTVPFFLLVRFFGGVASAFVLVFASALVLDRLRSIGRPFLSAVHFAGVGAGILVSAIIVSGLASAGLGWRSLWLASGIVALAAIIIAAVLVPEREEDKRPMMDGSPRRGLSVLIFAYGLFGFGYVITATFLVTIVRDSPSIAAFEPMIWAIVGVAAIPSVVVWTWFGTRYGNIRAFSVACAVESVGVLASVIWANPAGIVLSAVLLGGTFMGITALGLAGAREMAAGDPRRIMAAMTAAFGFGQIVGPAFAGFMHDATGDFVLSSLAAAAALVLATILTSSFVLSRATHRPRPL